VANFRIGPGRKWKLRDQRDPGWIYHRLPEQHQAIYAMYRTKLRKDVLQCSPKTREIKTQGVVATQVPNSNIL
jgi:hypothetical protein